jgi:hypothetical protein
VPGKESVIIFTNVNQDKKTGQLRTLTMGLLCVRLGGIADGSPTQMCVAINLQKEKGARKRISKRPEQR